MVREKFAALAGEIERATGHAQTPEEVAEGFLRIAVANMANAIKFISVQRGHDVTEYTLACFGGAGGQHACLVADELGMKRVFIHPLAGVLSAYGMGLAQVRAMREEAVERRSRTARCTDVEEKCVRAGRAVRARARGAGRARSSASTSACTCKYEGTDTALAVPLGATDAMRARVRAPLPPALQLPHARSRARRRGGVGRGGRRERDAPAEAPSRERARRPRSRSRVAHVAHDHAAAAARHAGVSPRARSRPARASPGPAIIAERNATTVVEPGWEARVTGAGPPRARARASPREARYALGTAADPVMLEVFNNLFMSIAEQMGVRLAKTAYSVNIKERLDFSCALFDAEGNLIANAPHMPVHLGSMGESIKTVIAQERRAR